MLVIYQLLLLLISLLPWRDSSLHTWGCSRRLHRGASSWPGAVGFADAGMRRASSLRSLAGLVVSMSNWPGFLPKGAGQAL